MGPRGLSSFVVGVGILELNSPLLVLLLFFILGFCFLGNFFSWENQECGGMLVGRGFWGFFFFWVVENSVF